MGGLCHVRKEMLAQKGDIWRGGLALGGEEGGQIKVATASCELLTASPSAFSLAAALSSPVLENHEGWWALKSANTICSPRSSRKVSKSGA